MLPASLKQHFSDWFGRRKGAWGKKPLCNLRPDRAPHIGTFVFPLCWRCCGILAGAAIAIILLLAGIRHESIALVCLFALPLILDSGLQEIFGVESTNPRRFITGIIWSLAIVFM